MGGLISITNKDGEDDRQKIRSRAQSLGRTDDGEASEGILEGDPRRAVRWYHWIIYDMRFRVVYATLLGLLLGIGLPLLIYFTVLSNLDNSKYGNCLINPEYRFQCLINSVNPNPSDSQCHQADGCFTDDGLVPFQCHHSFPPSYQYRVNSIDNLDLTLSPVHPKTMSDLRVTFGWQEDGHLLMEIHDRFKSVSESPVVENNTPRPIEIQLGSDSFYVHLRRNSTDETIFDTRLGPVIWDRSALSFSTVLPTEFYWGFKGGHGGGTVTQAVVNGPGSGELPFYLALEKSGDFHGVLIETSAPFWFQYIEAPAILVHFQDESGVKLRFFPGTSPQDVYAQVEQYKQRFWPETNSFLPPYWTLGLHLCRIGYDADSVLEQVLNLVGTERLKGIPYDSDCIEETLRQPFAFDESAFPTNQSTFTNILKSLRISGKKLFLSQGMPLDLEVSEEHSVSLILSSEGTTPLVGFQTGSDSTTRIVYPDYTDESTWEWAGRELSTGLESGIPVEFQPMIGGLVLVDNFPETGNASIVCSSLTSGIRSKLGMVFTNLGLICGDALHQNGTKHLSVHNAYGTKTLAGLRSAFESWAGSSRRSPLIGASIWTGLGSQDGFTGIQVPFSWTGLTQSLTQILRNFVMNPVLVGTPICGSFLDDGGAEESELETLCLRWFQLGLLLPFARNTKTGGIHGPTDFNLKYRSYLIASVENRYRFNPYYYTQLYHSHLSPAPLIRPLIYDFHSTKQVTNNTRGTFSQFMIGPALMAAPILSESNSRQVYFPPGTWYDLHGNLVTVSTDGGKTLTVPSLLAEIPVYIRSGHVIPTLNQPVESTAEGTRRGKYTILAIFPEQPQSISQGSLYVDDGTSVDSISQGAFNYVGFSTSEDTFTVTLVQCGLPTMDEVSTVIGEIKVVGFPPEKRVVRIVTVPDIGHDIVFKQVNDIEETGSLRLTNLEFDWCSHQSTTFTWILEDTQDSSHHDS